VTTSTFALDISRFVDKTKSNIDDTVRRVTLDIFSRVIQKSPVLTGRFKSAWVVGINSIPSDLPEGTDTNASQARVDAAIPLVKAGDVVTLINHIPYAVALEFGHSKQAANGMIRTTLAEFESVVQSAVSEVNS
jgi:hypothetical protein